MSKAITQARRLQMYARATTYEVMDLLEWDMMLYCMFKYECGRRYLEVHLRGDIAAIRQLEESRAYWGWWKLHWYMREREWLDSLHKYENELLAVQADGTLRWMYKIRPVDSPIRGLHGRRAIYKIIHNPDDLARGMTTTGKLMDDSYCNELVKQLR